MSDICDDAQQVEAFVLQDAMASMPQLTGGPAPVIIDGVVCCAECEEPIPLARLRAVPGCGLCAACKEETENR